MIKKSIYIGVALIALVAIAPRAFAEGKGDNTEKSDASRGQSFRSEEAPDVTLLKEAVRTFETEHKTATTFAGVVHKGTHGSTVSTIQTILALDPTIYPSTNIDGVFGPFTLSAVKKFQEENGLVADGIVGAKTKAKLDDTLAENDLSTEDTNGDGQGDKVCAIIPPGHLIAPGWLKHNGGIGPTIPTCQTLPAGILAKLGLTVPPGSDTTPPVISALTTTAITATTATVSFTTNEQTKATVWYGTVNPLDTTATSTLSAVDATLATSHTITLTGLTPATAYYLIVGAADAASNVTNSAQQSFTTIAGTPDTTAPMISTIGVSAITATGSQINWTTDEGATGKVYYSATNPVDTVTALTQSTPALSLAHALTLAGLTAHTTYYYVVESADGAGNKTTAPQNTFTTTL